MRVRPVALARVTERLRIGLRTRTVETAKYGLRHGSCDGRVRYGRQAVWSRPGSRAPGRQRVRDLNAVGAYCVHPLACVVDASSAVLVITLCATLSNDAPGLCLVLPWLAWCVCFVVWTQREPNGARCRDIPSQPGHRPARSLPDAILLSV
jgi:hypothetical protein